MFEFLLLRHLLRRKVDPNTLSLDGDVLDTLGKMLTRKAGLSDRDKSKLWYEISKLSFAKLGAVDIYREIIPSNSFRAAMTAGYPSITDIKIPDVTFKITNLVGLQRILSMDWSNLVPYLAEFGDCDDFAIRLYLHLVDYFQITGVIPVWGDTSSGYHAFNLAILREEGNLIARLVEPQKDQIFVSTGALGDYIPRKTAIMLAKITVKGD